MSVLTFTAKPYHQNENYTCIGSFKDFYVSLAIQLDVDSKNIKIIIQRTKHEFSAIFT